MKLILSITSAVLILMCSCTSPNNNTGDIIKIGEQVWMTKNLGVSTYRNGDIIPQVTNPAQWSSLTTGAWCYYDNEAANGTKYGKLYNWYAVNDPRGLAPIGYHVPSDEEWSTLTTFLGGDEVAGGKMKSTGTTLWSSPNTDASNSSGFAGLPGGNRYLNGTFYYIGLNGDWWSSTENNTTNAWHRHFNYGNGNVVRNNLNKTNGCSVRCLRD